MERKNFITKVVRKFLKEQQSNKVFLGYHSSRHDFTDGFYKGDTLNEEDYEDLIRSAYLDIISDNDENLENNDISAMNSVFEEIGYGFTFVSTEPIEASAFQTDKYKYGNHLYKVYGDGNEILLDDPNEINATIVASKKPLYFEQIS